MFNRGSFNKRRNANDATPPPYFGAAEKSQKCQLLIAPMGRVIDESQQCHIVVTLPNHLTGGHVQVAEMPCIVRPHLILVPLQVRRNANQLPRQWEGSQRPCSNAALPSPFPTLQQGVVNSPQECLRRCTPTLQQGANKAAQKCHFSCAPTLFGVSRHPQKCQLEGAPTTRGQRNYAEMPPLHRLA